MTAACRARADLRWMSTSNEGYVTARVPRPYAPRKVSRELIAYMVRPDRQPRCPNHVWRLAGHFPRQTTRDASTDADPAARVAPFTPRTIEAGKGAVPT